MLKGVLSSLTPEPTGLLFRRFTHIFLIVTAQPRRLFFVSLFRIVFDVLETKSRVVLSVALSGTQMR